MKELVKIVPEDSIALDSFAGSGTTCVAAKKMEHQFIGIEKDEGFAEML